MFRNNNEIIVQTQKEFNKIKDTFSGVIRITETKESISVNRQFCNANIYVYGNATIESIYGNATIESIYGNATIESIYGNAMIESIYGNATIESIYGNAMIESVSGNATIKYVYGNATIKYVSGNATIESIYGNAMIESIYGNATILLLTGLASIVLLYSAKKIVAKGMNLIRQIGTKKIDIEMTKSVTFVQIKETFETNPTIEMFSKMYPVEKNKKKVILYKAVHKKDDYYFSDYNKNFTYKIGEIKEEKNDDSKNCSCSYGIHLAHKNWALLFGKSWSDMAIIECETDIKNIVVSTDCDGKLRTSKIKVIRELPESEY